MTNINLISKRSTFILSILVVLLTAFTTNVWGASPATLTFTAACGGSGTDSDGNTWTVTSDAAESTYDGTKGIHYGTNKKAVSYLNLTTSGISGTITSISVNASGASGTSAKLNVTVGGSAFGSEKSLTSTATSYSFTGSASGTIVVAITQSSAKVALYCKSISVTYSSGGSPTLSSISVSTAPTKVTYTEGEYFDPTGLVITRSYSNSTTDTYAYAGHASDFSFTPSTSTALTTSNTSVTITYGGKSTSQAITVTSGGGGGGGSTATFVWGSNPTKYTKEATSVTEGLVTFTGTKGTGSTPTRCWTDGLRLYNGSTANFSVPDGYVITKIEGYSEFAYNNATGSQSVDFSGWSSSLTCKSDVTVTYSASGTAHTLSSAVSPTGTGTVTLGSTSVVEGGTTTATATANTGYVFSSWSISGTGASLSSTTTNPTTITMGTANATITANFVVKTAASITLSIAGSTSSVSGYYVGDSYTPPTTAAECSGKTFVGWSSVAISPASATKPASNYYEKGESVTLAASQTFYAVYASSTSGAGGSSVEVTYDSDNFPTGYGTANTFTEYTLEGYKFKIQQVYKSGDKMQWRAAGNSNGTGTIYNNETFPGHITSIVLEYDASDGNKNHTLKIGSSANPSSGTSITPTNDGGTTYTFDCSSYSYDYFVMENGSGAGYTASITINYGGAATYSNYTTNCIACATPILTFTNSTLTKYVGDANFTNTLTISNNNVSGAAVTYASNLPAKAEVNSSTGEVTIKQSTIDGTPVIITASRAAADNGSACDVAVQQTYTLIIKNKIEWYSNETKITSGSQTQEANFNGTISAIPSTPSVPSACSSKTFVGWTTEANWNSDDAPDPLYSSLDDFSSLKIQENKTYYAVFAETTTGDPELTLTQTLQYDTWSYSGTTKNMSSYRLFGDGSYVQSGSSVNWSNVSQIVVYGGTYGGDGYDDISIRKEDGSTIWKDATVSTKSEKHENTISGGASLTGTSKLRVYSTCGNGTGTGVRISKVEIYEMVASTVGTAYATKCCTNWDDPTMTYSTHSLEVGDEDATLSKSGTEHGTLSFSSSNESIATVNSSGTVHAVSPGNVTITASWTKQGAYCAKEINFNFTITGDVTISFDANGGTGSMASQVVPYSTSTALNTMSGLTAPVGQSFIGWNTQADGKGDSYADKASVKFTTNTTLFAQWGTAYTITLHRSGATQELVLLSSQFPYTLPVAESDYCDAWQFDGWSASAVNNNSTAYDKVIKAETAEDAHFYAVYRGDSYNTEAFARISSTDDLTSGNQYIFVANSKGKKHVMTNNYSTTYNNNGEISTTEIAESGKDFFFTSVIPATSVYTINKSGSYWYIKNVSNNQYINVTQSPWYTSSTSTNTYTISPNSLYWDVISTASITYKYLEAASWDKNKPKDGAPARVVFCTYNKHSGSLMIYKKGIATAYHYTSTPSGEGCTLPCTDCGAQFTYQVMDKSISSKPFSNPIVYNGTTNTAEKSFSSSKESVATVNATTGVVTVEGIGETTITMAQLRDNTDPVHPICGITISYKVIVTSPSLEIVEVTADDKIIVEHDFEGITKATVDSSKMDIKGTIADDIFISKYYEAASEMKLIGLYNGTEHAVDLSQLRVRTSKSGGVWGGSENHGEAYLGRIVKLGEDYPDFLLPPFTEIVLWSNNESGDNNGGNAQLCYCVNMTIDKKEYNYDDMTAGKVPNWYRIGNSSGGIDSDGNKTFNFNGDDAIILERSTDDWSTWTAIDLFGAGTPEAPVADPTGNANGYVQKKSINDSPGGWYWDATSAGGTVLSTNRFYLTRLSSVKSGMDAVEKNATSFVTLGEEWKGEGIGGGTNMTDYCGSGELFSEVATYDFAKYYTDYVKYEDKFTASDNGDGTFTLQFNTGELEKLSCKKIKISVQDALDATKTAEVEYRVPIIVKENDQVTTDAIFNKHDKDECKVCDVAVLNGAVLTKSKPTTPAQVAADREQVYNVDVYGGGELYIPTGTTYNINTLTVRSKGDAVGIVDVQGKLNRSNTTLFHNKRFHAKAGAADYRWYYFSLPYDCDVNTVTFTNGDPAVHGVDFEIDWYDGESRASSQANGNWRSIATHPDHPNIIKAGFGYTIAVEIKAGHDNVGLLFPMANFKETTQEIVPVGNWGAGDDGVTVNHKGWNVVGNPFLTRYKAQEELDLNGELRTGMLVFEGGGWTQTPNGINYATVPLNGGVSGYSQEALTGRDFDPFQSFIIQVGGDAERSDLVVQLKNTYKDKRSSIVRRYAGEYETGETTPVWLRLNLNNAENEADYTTILISDNYTAEYDMQYDLAKWRGSSYKYYTRPVLASVYGGHELAFNALPDSIVAERVPLTYYSRNAGKMAFELSSAYNWQALEEVILYDEKEGTKHNLLTEGKYEFNSAADEIGNRFYISAKVNRHKTPTIHTDVDLVEAQNIQLSVREHTIHINGLEAGTQVFVFDMSGRLVGRQIATTPYMNFHVPAFGVYNIRLMGEKAGTTLRALVQQ